MDNVLIKDMLYLCMIAGVILVSLVISFRITIYRLRQKNYFLNRDRERYAETLYASKDGYFAFVYPDERINDPRRSIRERCSRRLAVMLNLKNGVSSNFGEVLGCFYKEDAKKMEKYLKLLQEEYIAFEDTFCLKNNNRKMSVYGARINANDGNLYCDMLWFRDLSEEMLKIEDLNQNLDITNSNLQTLNDLIDNLSYPVWLRNESLEIIAVNKKYVEYSGLKDKKEVLQRQLELADYENLNNMAIAKSAQQTNKIQKKNINLILGGQAHNFEIIETPFHTKGHLDKISTVGSAYDMTELDNVKRTFKVHQTAHLEVLSALGTAFAIFDTSQKLIFHNKSFLNLWNLTSDFTSNNPSYSDFLEKIRSFRLLPEVSDFKGYKENELKLFDNIIESKEDLLHIPDGRTIKRVVCLHPNGLIFAFEDVSDKLAATRMINELLSIQQNILDNISDSVLIFGADHKLKYFNNNYVKLWKADVVKLQNLPAINEVIQMQKSYFSDQENWEQLKQNMLAHILNICARFRIERTDNVIIEVTPKVLPDESIMITYVVK
ncbi:MAG: PAS domain-containing protein [Alphaproteobacteria bacterium]|nr:PAS domain-containing protein [Alphaproteobacteria bacterium]